jgi:hypothetical protein
MKLEIVKILVLYLILPLNLLFNSLLYEYMQVDTLKLYCDENHAWCMLRH